MTKIDGLRLSIVSDLKKLYANYSSNLLLKVIDDVNTMANLASKNFEIVEWNIDGVDYKDFVCTNCGQLIRRYSNIEGPLPVERND